MRLFREALSLVSRSAHPKSWPRFITAFQRFNRAFRGRDEFENFVDLVVALEGLFGVREEELRFRLAVRAALLLGDSGAGSRIVYRQVTAAYHIRNTLVHGQGSSNDIERSLMKEVAHIVPLDSRHPTELREVIAFNQALLRMRQITRRALWGYARLQGLASGEVAWPKREEEWYEMLSNSKGVRDLQRRLPFFNAPL
jgi:hypothetical protein